MEAMTEATVKFKNKIFNKASTVMHACVHQNNAVKFTHNPQLLTKVSRRLD